MKTADDRTMSHSTEDTQLVPIYKCEISNLTPLCAVTVFLDCLHTFSESWVNLIECSHLLCPARVFSGEWVNYFSLLSHKFLRVLTHFSKQLTHFSEKDTKPN